MDCKIWKKDIAKEEKVCTSENGIIMNNLRKEWKMDEKNEKKEDWDNKRKKICNNGIFIISLKILQSSIMFTQ